MGTGYSNGYDHPLLMPAIALISVTEYGNDKENIKKRGARGIITDGKNRAYLAEKENFFDNGTRKYLSLIPLDEEISDICMDGFKYPFKASKLLRQRFVTVSNEIEKQAKITLGSGLALIVESGD